MSRLQGKTALITGAQQGIGEAIALRFAAEGAGVAINYYDDAAQAESVRARAAEANPSGRHMIVQADVSREDQVQAMFAEAIERMGALDILVNNAGIQKESPSHEVPLRDFERVLDVNLVGSFLCAREALRHFLTRGGGVILNNTSVHQTIPKPGYLSYSISKGAMENLTKTLALEYADRGIRVNSVGPGATATQMNARWTGDPKLRAEVVSHIPMARAADPAEVAAAFAFLASDEAAYITGQTIFVCGGLMLYPDFRENWAS
jgi:glucose 1-dehydrogenase